MEALHEPKAVRHDAGCELLTPPLEGGGAIPDQSSPAHEPPRAGVVEPVRARFDFRMLCEPLVGHVNVGGDLGQILLRNESHE